MRTLLVCLCALAMVACQSKPNQPNQPNQPSPHVEAVPGPGNSSGPPAKTTHTTSNVSGAINCDCDHVNAGLLTGPYKDQCHGSEKQLRQKVADNTFKVEVKDDKIVGGDVCDGVASGDNAWPRKDGPVNPPKPDNSPGCKYVGGLAQYDCPSK